MRKPNFLVDMNPPGVLGAAFLTTSAFRGESMDSLIGRIAAHPSAASRLHDEALIMRLCFQPSIADALQDQALALSQVFRTESQKDGGLRVLAVLLPGDLMANTPLDFMLHESDVRLDLLYVRPGKALPAAIPDHDIAVFAGGNSNPAICAELQAYFDAWPRPAINPPRCVPGLERDALPKALGGISTICSPPTTRLSNEALREGLDFSSGPQLVRPAGTHAGQGLVRVGSNSALWDHLAATCARSYYVTPYIDYRGADGMFRKYRVAFVAGEPFLCHMAVSEHWMIHYLNAGMTESAAKRAEEAHAMAHFSEDFAQRHQSAFAALSEVIELDYYSIDCAETRDGKLLVFEADNAAIIHMMDPPALFPYKQQHMQKVFAAFVAMLEQRSAGQSMFVDKQSFRRRVGTYSGA
jgi:hypothetical protein